MSISYKSVPEPDRVAVERVLISVFDKKGIVEFAQALAGYGVEILSTGGTARALSDARLTVTDVEKITEFPEILDGRVKTLHPAIHGGLLAIRGNAEHLSQLETHGIAPIDMVVTNLYPFESVAEAGADFGEAIENIDIGGPAMIRASAKNHAYVCVVTQAEDYQLVLQDMETNGGATSLKLRRRLAATAFSRTAAYDCAVSDWFQRQLADEMPDRLTIGANRELSLRYGENPHQDAALYSMGEKRPGVVTAERLQGRELSYNNINDADAAFELVSEFDPLDHAAVAIIKHANPCGVAVADDLATAYERALACDPVSAFGGIIALNRELDEAAACRIVELFTEVVIAPAASRRARKILAEKKNLRLLVTGELADPASPGRLVRTIAGGLLVQSRDSGRIGQDDLKVVTKRQPNEGEIADALFAFRVAKHVKSNAIVYARRGATVGIGAGQMSRVDSARIAAWKAEEAAKKAGLEESLARGSVVASDAFFPFADGLLAAADAGATAVIQPGGSMRDEEVIAAADEAGLAMMFTGMRHFRH